MSYWTDIIPKDWGYETLKSSVSNIVDNRGKTCPTATFGTPLIATNCIKEFALYPVFEKLRYVDDHTIKNWFRGHPEPNDILFVNKGTPGGVCIVPDPVPFCIAQDMVALRADPKKFNWKYLFTALRSNFVKSQIEALNVGTSIPHLKKTDFDRIVIPRPDLKIQQSIGEIYFSICEKIELNLQINITLEDMAMALYKHWFVDFGPFQDGEFEDSELGEIPKGWEVGSIKDFGQIICGKTPSKKDPKNFTHNGGYPFIKIPEMHGNVFVTETSECISEEGNQKQKKKLLPAGSINVSCIATVGLVTINAIPSHTNQQINSIVPEQRFYQHFLYPAMISLKDRFLNEASGGSATLNMNTTTFSNIEILKPDDKTLEEFSIKVNPFYSQILLNQKENKTLTKLRDTLLPKLISGEVRVKDIEKTLSEVL